MITRKFAKKGITITSPLTTFELPHNLLHLEKNEFPNSQETAETIVSLPLFPSLTDKETTFILKAIEEIFRTY